VIKSLGSKRREDRASSLFTIEDRLSDSPFGRTRLGALTARTLGDVSLVAASNSEMVVTRHRGKTSLTCEDRKRRRRRPTVLRTANGSASAQARHVCRGFFCQETTRSARCDTAWRVHARVLVEWLGLGVSQLRECRRLRITAGSQGSDCARFHRRCRDAQALADAILALHAAPFPAREPG